MFPDGGNGKKEAGDGGGLVFARIVFELDGDGVAAKRIRVRRSRHQRRHPVGGDEQARAL